MNQARSPSRSSNDRLPVSVILERRPSDSAWRDFQWRASGITIGERGDTPALTLVRETGDLALYLVGGLEVALFADECESYYYNLVSDAPRAWVVAHPSDGDDAPTPFRVSMSFDEAHAYLEGEDEIFAVDVPPELYLRVESFVIDNYFPEKKFKRKLRDWTADGRNPPEGA